MKNTIVTIIFLSCSIFLFGQEQEEGFFLETDTTWRKEIFHFPIRFAQNINYEGIEDARFPIGWEKKDSPNFWSYAFAWKIATKGELAENELEADLQKYFDGLMGIGVNKNEELLLQSTTAVFLKKENTKNTSRYIGKIKTIDSFFTKKPMTLNVLVDKYYCDEKKKAIILFRFSPKEFGDDVWHIFDEVKVPANVCDL